MRNGKPVDPHVVVAEVVRTTRITPSMVRVTLGGADLDRFTATGWDQWFRLFLPRGGQDVLRLPTRTSAFWYVEYLATPRAQRPWVRAYTVRDARPDDHELDVDFVVHLDGARAGADATDEDAPAPTGPAVTFALTAQPGDRVGLLDQGTVFAPRRPVDQVLLVGDETALPAVAGICAALPDDARGLAIVEVPSPDDVQPLTVPEGIEVRWVPRDAPGPGTATDGVPGRLALAELARTPVPDGPVQAYVAGESALATGARRLLVERGVPKSQIDFTGYWRHGHAAQ